MGTHNLPYQGANADWGIADPGNAETIRPIINGVCMLKHTTGAETRTLANPDRVGQELVLCMQNVVGGGSIVVTASRAVNATGNNTLTFNREGECIKLVSIYSATLAAHRWQAFNAYAYAGADVNEGPDLSTV